MGGGEDAVGVDRSAVAVAWLHAPPAGIGPGMVATAMLCFIFAWNEFIFALVLTRSAITTFPVQVTHYFGGQSNFWAKIAAMSMLGTVPIFIVVALLQRFLVRGTDL